MNTVNRMLPAIPKMPRTPTNNTFVTMALRVIKLLYVLSCFVLPCLVLLIALQLSLAFWTTALLVFAAILLVCLVITLPFKMENHLPASFVRVGPRIFFLYAEGFLMMNEDASRCHIVHWNELEEFWINRKSQYVVRLVNGLLVKIDTQGTQAKPLTDRIEREVAKRYAPAALTTYRQGQVLTFGRVRVSMQSIQVDDGFQQPAWHTLSWNDVVKVRTTFPHMLNSPINALLIYCKESHQQGNRRCYLVYLKDIPNISVLQEIIKAQHCPYQRGTLLF